MGATVTTSEAILLQLVGDKNHPKFKEIQGLIKTSAPVSGLVKMIKLWFFMIIYIFDVVVKQTFSVTPKMNAILNIYCVPILTKHFFKSIFIMKVCNFRFYNFACSEKMDFFSALHLSQSMALIQLKPLSIKWEKWYIPQKIELKKKTLKKI